MSATALYTDLSAYYDLMCSSINYRQQSDFVRRIHALFGNGGKQVLDLACGTGPHVRHFIDAGYTCTGLDIHQPMLDIAQQRCPEAVFVQGDMAGFTVAQPQDLITCFLYSMHYNADVEKLQVCLASVHAALQTGGVFVFNAVDKNTIANNDCAREAIARDDGDLLFESGWHYGGAGDKQELRVRIEKQQGEHTQVWEDSHSMVAASFQQIQALLEPLFDVHIFEHDYDKIVPWNGVSGNAIFVGVKR